ncbi:MAG: hypothetical protein O3A00_20250 [Planctomycetota bacterium]|nr:hypothetical protein [Planctomycetota bacterium]
MGFLQRFLKNTFRDGHAPRGRSSFENLSDEQLEEHLSVTRYGDFTLTDAVRPSYNLEVVPQAGYRHDYYLDNETGVKIPVIMAAASKEKMFDVFLDLLDPLGNEVDVVLETSHERNLGGHQDLYRECIDLPVLKSILYDFDDALLDDGCMGLAVLNPQIPLEVQFDEHKLLIMYGEGVKVFEEILEDYGLRNHTDIRFITEAEHVHSSTDEFIREFEQMRYRLGIDHSDPYEETLSF